MHCVKIIIHRIGQKIPKDQTSSKWENVLYGEDCPNTSE